MARMNKTAPITGRPRTRSADTHGEAVKAAHESGLAAYANKGADGKPLLHSSSQRRAAAKAKEMEAFRWAVANQGFAGDFSAWMNLSIKERAEYEAGAQGI